MTNRVCLLAAVAICVATPCLADQPLAGAVVYTGNNSSPICATPTSLGRYLDARIFHAPGAYVPADCTTAPYGTRVSVLEDLPIRNRVMHVIKARFDAPFPLRGSVGYSYSVGFLPPNYPPGVGSGYQPYTLNSGPGF